MAVSAQADPLLPPELLAKLERLELASRKIFKGQMKGERRSKRRGQSVEFDDFRTYVPGDDLRLIDWNLYARLDQLFLKLFQEEEDLHLYVLVDASDSMGFGDPSKFFVAKQLAAALGYVGMCRSDRVSVQALGREGRQAPVLRSRSSLWRMLRYLDGLRIGENISLRDSLKDFSTRHAGSGMVIVISDFLDKQGYEVPLRSLVSRRMDIFLMHLLAPEEIDPSIRGDRRLIDSEDADAAEVTINQYAIDRYKQTVTQFMGSLKEFCNRRSIAYVPITTEMPIDQMATSYLRKRGVVK